MIGTGFTVGLKELTGLKFRADKPHTFCRVCGAVFQSDADRDLVPPVGQFEVWAAESQRRRWSHNHAKQHTTDEHDQLAVSGRFCTPEAAHKLVPFGVISITDAIFNSEYEAALYESKPIPVDDSEGT